jgi:DNA-binding MarR family transcriptional regulator
MVGVAPSTIAGRLNRLLDRGWVRRRSDPASGRSWLIELTPEGLRLAEASLHYTEVMYSRLDQALGREGLSQDLVRDVVGGLSAALPSLLPEAAQA